MEKVPETRKSELEKVQKELEEEVSKWEDLGMTLDNTVHPNSELYAAKFQLQTIINVLRRADLIPFEEFDLEFKKLVLDDMQKMRAQYGPTMIEQRRQAIISGGAKPPLVVPDFKLLGPDGKEIKF